jgi:hypothetical protein|uniref:Uncharacterized protein n=1 Tax=viral metagenome TaxID=1070528 RepID=A0A6C0DTE6_9ZZZZ
MDTIINSFQNKTLKRIVNVYQLKYVNGAAQGLGDYIRGCFCLMQVCSLLGLEFDMDLTNHPMSKFINQEDKSPKYIVNYEKIAKYGNINYIPINSKAFKKDSVRFFSELINNLNSIDCDIFFTFCNSLPIFDNFTDIGCQFVLSKLRPNELMQKNIYTFLTGLNLKQKQFAVIHIRSGDKYMLNNNQLNPFVLKKITNILAKNMKLRTKYLILSDNNQIKLLLKKIFPNIIIQISNIIHLGECDNPSDQAVMETLLDFYIMSNAFQIISFSPYNWGSGFSQWCATLHKIPFLQFQVLDYLS